MSGREEGRETLEIMNAQNLQRKAESLEHLRECLKKASIIILTDYRGQAGGLTVKAITELRGKLRECDGIYKIAKNTLIRKALSEINIECEAGTLEGPTAVVFGMGDPAAAAKAVLEFAKTQKPNGLPVVKGAVMDNRLLSIDELKAIAALPSIEVLRMQLLGLMLAPHRNILGVLNATGRSMATVLDTWNEKRSKEEAQEA